MIFVSRALRASDERQRSTIVPAELSVAVRCMFAVAEVFCVWPKEPPSVSSPAALLAGSPLSEHAQSPVPAALVSRVTASRR